MCFSPPIARQTWIYKALRLFYVFSKEKNKGQLLQWRHITVLKYAHV